MSNILNLYFKRELTRRHYPTEDICYRLGHSQGDGMSFYGDIATSNLASLADRLLSGQQKAAAKRAIAKNAAMSISRNSFGQHYSHWNTMNVIAQFYYADELTSYKEAAFEALEEVIQEDVRDVSRTLESECYSIINCGSQSTLDKHGRRYSTKRFCVIVDEVEEDDFDMSEYDDELTDDIYQQLVNEQARFFCLRVTVKSHTGLELGQAFLGHCLYSNIASDRFYSGYLRQKVAEAVKDARNTIGAFALSSFAA